jgi:predicted nucleic acid-binding protein
MSKMLQVRHVPDALHRTLKSRAAESGESLHAPHLIDVEVCQVLRRYVATGILGSDRGEEALRDLADLPLRRYPHYPFLERAWQLQANLTAYDAVYIALAEALDAVLLTRDRKLASSPGHAAQVRVV